MFVQESCIPCQLNLCENSIISKITRSLGLKAKAKIKYHRCLEVQIFIGENERFQSQNRIEALNKN